MFPEFSWTEAVGGSFTFIVLVACSVVTLGVSLERWYYFWKRGRSPQAVYVEVMRRIESRQGADATWICRSCTHPMGPVVAEILKAPNASKGASEERLQVALSEQKLLLERNLVILGTMAATAPLIGLLGTVWGIMRAFRDMAIVGSAAPVVVAAGIPEALITTAAGLIVAVPAVVLYNHFSRRMNVMLITAENHARSIRVALNEAAQPAAGQAPANGFVPAGAPARTDTRAPREGVSRERELTTVS